MYRYRIAYLLQRIETDERKKKDALKQKDNKNKAKEKKDETLRIDR